MIDPDGNVLDERDDVLSTDQILLIGSLRLSQAL
jgi:hypothetical protein